LFISLREVGEIKDIVEKSRAAGESLCAMAGDKAIGDEK
jgi:hypothetical protein